MQTRLRASLLIVLVIGVAIAGGCVSQQPPVTGPKVTAETPQEFETGESLYNTNCAKCHGPRGVGTSEGPPLLHETYAPDHHADESFQIAVRQGVQPHHWQYGKMPPIGGLEREDVDEIIGYVRWLQQEAGIIGDNKNP